MVLELAASTRLRLRGQRQCSNHSVRQKARDEPLYCRGSAFKVRLEPTTALAEESCLEKSTDCATSAQSAASRAFSHVSSATARATQRSRHRAGAGRCLNLTAAALLERRQQRGAQATARDRGFMHRSRRRAGAGRCLHFAARTPLERRRPRERRRRGSRPQLRRGYAALSRRRMSDSTVAFLRLEALTNASGAPHHWSLAVRQSQGVGERAGGTEYRQYRQYRHRSFCRLSCVAGSPCSVDAAGRCR
jgi:hypothetical protein